MKLRKWALLLGGLFLLGSIGVYISWDLVKADERIKLMIQREAGQQLGEIINVDRARIGFGHVALDNLEFSFNNGIDEIKIKELQIGWNTLEFIKSWFEPQKGVTEVKLIEPVLIIGSESGLHEKQDEHFSERRDQIIEQIEKTTAQLMSQFKNVVRIEISDGTIYYRNLAGEIYPVARDFQGELIKNSLITATLDISAKLLSTDHDNLKISANLNLENYNIIADVLIDDYDLGAGLPEFIENTLVVTKGTLNGRIQVVKSSLSQGENNYSYEGTIRVNDASYLITDRPNIVFKNVNLAATLEQDLLTIDSFTQEFHDGIMEITGTIKNLFVPELNLSSNFSNVDLSSLGIDSSFIGLAGTVDGSMNVTGSGTVLAISGNLQSRSLELNDYHLTQMKSDFSFNFPDLVVENFDARYRDTAISLRFLVNFIDFDSSRISGTVEGDLLSLFDNIPLLENNGYYGRAEFEFIQLKEQLEGHGTVLLSSTNDKGTIALEGKFQIGDKIYVEGESLEKDFDFKGTISHDLSSFRFEFMDALSIISHEFDLPDDLIAKMPDILNLTLSGDGVKTELYADALTDQSELLFTLNGEYEKNSNGAGVLKSNFKVLLPGEKSFTISTKISKNNQVYLIEEISSPGLFNGSMQIVENGELKLNGELNVETTVGTIADLTGYEFLDNGNLNGTITIGGTFDSPEINSTLILENGIKNTLTGLSGALSFSSQNWTDFVLNELFLKNNDSDFLEASGIVNLTEGTAEIDIMGSDIASDIYGQFLFSNGELLNGPVSYKIHYSRNDTQSEFSGSIIIPAGRIGKYGFTDFELVVHPPGGNRMMPGESDNSDNRILPGGFWVQSLNMKTIGDISVNGDGYISFNGDQSNFDLSIDGNLLSIFPASSDFFQFSDGKGIVKINVGGNITNPVINSGYITIADGVLHLESVIDKIENVNVKAVLDSDSRFIDIEEFTGTLDGKTAWIENEQEVQVEYYDETVSLFPFELMDDGLNIGILSLHTSDKGVDIHIPDIMDDQEEGNLQLKGLDGEEKFYFAGGNDRSENPYVRGTIILRDSRITYPPLEIDENPGFVKRFLNIVNWDMQVVPESNNFYVRSEPSSVLQIMDDIFGDIQIELKIEDESEGLHFGGISDDDEDILFNVTGDLISIRGTIETLLEDFIVESFELYFTQGEPFIKGIAKTTLKDPDINTGTLIDYIDVYLILVSDEKDEQGNITGKVLNYGTWDENDLPDYRFQLSLDQSVGSFSPVIGTLIKNEAPVINQILTTEGRILKLFGITPENIDRMAIKLAGDRVGEVIFNPITVPFNRSMRRWTGLDEFSIKARIRRSYDYDNVFPSVQIPIAPSSESVLQYMYLSPELRIGKYLSPSLFLLYENQLVRTLVDGQNDLVGLNHAIGLQYRMPNNMLFEVQYDYDIFRYLNKGDAKIWFRHQIQLKGIKKNQ